MIPVESLRVFAAFASLFTLAKLFDWLRLFEKTGFYVKLVGETLNDIKYFILLLLTTLVMFGVPVVMLDASSSEDKDLMEKVFNFWLLDLFYTQYMLALGMFEPENYGDHPQAILAFLFFLGATVMSQLTMLNMLIAIMGDSFDRVFENQEIHSVSMRLQILGDLSAVLP